MLQEPNLCFGAVANASMQWHAHQVKDDVSISIGLMPIVIGVP